MDLQKIINIFEEHGFNENNCSFFRQEDITDIAKEIEAAINYTHCCTELCKHENETLHQGNGFIYKTCTDCGEDI